MLETGPCLERSETWCLCLTDFPLSVFTLNLCQNNAKFMPKGDQLLCPSVSRKKQLLPSKPQKIRKST